MTRLFVAAAFASLGFVHATAAAAQGTSQLSVDFDATVGTSRGGVYADRGRLGLDLLGAARFREIASGSWIAGVGVGLEGQPGSGDKCLITPTSTGCLPDTPSLATWTALVGWEGGRPGAASLRLLVGPGFYSGGGSSNIGAMARADVATPTRLHVALTATGRGSLVSVPGGATSVWAAGIGVRVR